MGGPGSAAEHTLESTTSSVFSSAGMPRRFDQDELLCLMCDNYLFARLLFAVLQAEGTPNW